MKLSVKNTFVSACLIDDDDATTDSFLRQTSDPTHNLLSFRSQLRVETPIQEAGEHDGADDEDVFLPQEGELSQNNFYACAAFEDRTDVVGQHFRQKFGVRDARLQDDLSTDSTEPCTGSRLTVSVLASESCRSTCMDSESMASEQSVIEDKVDPLETEKFMDYSVSHNAYGDALPKKLVLNETLSFKGCNVLDGQADDSDAREFEGSCADGISQLPQEWHGKTSVMLKNIPYSCTYHVLREALHNAGFARAYDYLYLPMDTRTSSNKGYAFINFLHDQAAYNFKTQFHLRKWNPCSTSTKRLEVIPANLQGFSANRTRYSSCRKLRKSGAADQQLEAKARVSHPSQRSVDLAAPVPMFSEKPMTPAALAQYLEQFQQQGPANTKHGKRR